ncbi:MAG: efflux RND transporter periplasmic adaptor subunit [Burkholderiaceae bacterium]|nr:efflux RND transporter periplasmic adaptor subunit [Burkholderiaceae bacterium]
MNTAVPRPAFAVAFSSALLALLLIGGCSKPGAPAGGPPGAPPVSVAAAVQRTVTDIEEFTGRLEAPRSVEVRPRIGGTIDQVHFRDGARVAQGAMLFTIDPKPFEAELARAQSQLTAARSRAGLASSELARAKKLLDAKAVSAQEFDQLTSGAATSGADIAAAEAALRVAQLNLGYTRVRAPMAGQLSRAIITEGNLVNDQSVLTTLVATQTVYAYFDGSEQTFLRLRKGAPGQQLVHMGLADETGFPHEGKVDFVDNQLNPQTGSIRMRAVFDNAKGEFTPGLFTRLQLAGGAAYPAVMTPERAIGTDQSKKLVFVIGEGNVAQAREVHLGTLIDGMRVVTSGLKAGDLVVVDGLQRVRPGAPVQPIKVETDERGMPIAKPAAGAPPAAPAPAASAPASAAKS